MARMSIDDMVARDPRITALADRLGWSRRETVGCLVSDVWPVCYDQVTHLISGRLIDIAAKHDGFAIAMLECELAHKDRSGKLYVSGAKERVRYIKDKQIAGREGGLKSGQSRRSTPKQTGKQTPKQREAAGNPPDSSSVPDSDPVVPPDPDLALSPDPRADARELRPAPGVSISISLAASWRPKANHEQLAQSNGLTLELEAQKFSAHARSNGRHAVDWDAAFETWLLSSPRLAAKSSSKNSSDAILRIARGEQS